MPRIVPQHWKVLKCVFLKAGFKQDRQTDSHLVLVKEGVLRPVIIPKYKSIRKDIIHNNIRTAGISREDYFKYLDKC